MKTLRLDEREIHTLLAALSWWTSRRNPTVELRRCVELLAEGEGEFDPLTDVETNALMDRIAATEVDCDGDFIEAHAEPGSIGAELAERLDRPGPREVLVVAGATDLRGVPERLALPFGRQYVMVLADDDPIVKMLRNPAPMSMSMSVAVLPSSDGVTPSTDELYGGPFLGSPVPEPEVRLPADWRDRRPADEDCDGDEP